MKRFARSIANNIFGIIGISLITFAICGIFIQFLPINRALFVGMIGLLNLYEQSEQVVELGDDEVMDI